MDVGFLQGLILYFVHFDKIFFSGPLASIYENSATVSNQIKKADKLKTNEFVSIDSWLRVVSIRV